LPFFFSFDILTLKLEKRGCYSWHTLLVPIALVAVLVRENAQFLQLAKAMIDMLSMQIFALIAVHAPVFAQ
jgi:hypothetical protein